MYIAFDGMPGFFETFGTAKPTIANPRRLVLPNAKTF
jgi:hypothetical protein